MTIIAGMGYGSSDDDDDDDDSVDEDSVNDDDEDCRSDYDVHDNEDAEEDASDGVTRGDDACIKRIESTWRQGRLATSSLGEWARLFIGLEKWHFALSEVERQFMGPLTKPFHR